LGSKTKNPSDRTFPEIPNEVQDELLMGLIQSAKNTELGKEYDYPSYVLMTLLLKEFPSVRMKNFNH
jgi:hypothetical protein